MLRAPQRPPAFAGALPPPSGGSPPEAIIISGPDSYRPHLTRLYGGYKRTRNLYGRATYQKDPDQGDSGLWEAFIYWSAVDSKWCVSPQLGESIGELHERDPQAADPVPIYQVTESACDYPSLQGPWVVNPYGTGARYEVEHVLTFEALELPPQAADPARREGGFMHICTRKFVDYEFPPKVTSIQGDKPPLRPAVSQGYCAEAAYWLPATHLSGQMTGPLFGNPREPRGDWLAEVPPERGGIYPVLAAGHEYPGHYEMLFAQSLEVSPLGNYTIWLYDAYESRWRRVTVDEFVPVTYDPAGRPIPWCCGHGRSLWALLLEKALAKLCGSYEALRRTEPGPLLLALTGERGRLAQWQRDNGWWSQWALLLPGERAAAPAGPPPYPASEPGLHQRVRAVRPLRCAHGRVGGSWQKDSELFRMLWELHRGNALILAYADVETEVGGDPKEGQADPSGSGLVRGHGYSLLGLVEVDEDRDGGGLRLVQLRNPWGSGLQWRGRWADGAAEWEAFPDVRRHHLRPEHRATGRFWMAWPDFCEAFDRVEVCPMPAAARKASFVPRLPRGRRPAAAQRGRRSSGGWGLFQWRCCAVETSRD